LIGRRAEKKNKRKKKQKKKNPIPGTSIRSKPDSYKKRKENRLIQETWH